MPVFNASAFIPELWNDELIDGLEKAKNLFKTISWKGAPLGADTVHVPLMGVFEATTKDENNEVVDQASDFGDVVVSLDQKPIVSTLIDRFDQLQSPTSLEDRLKKINAMSEPLWKDMDSKLVALFEGLTPPVGHSVSNQAAAINLDTDTKDEVVEKIEQVILKARAVLNQEGIAKMSRFIMLSSHIVPLLLRTDRYANRNTIGQENLVEGTIIRAWGADWLEVDELEADFTPGVGEDPGVTTVNGYFYNSSCCAIGIQSTPTFIGSWDSSKHSNRLVCDAVFGLKKAREKALVRMTFHFVGNPFGLA